MERISARCDSSNNDGRNRENGSPRLKLAGEKLASFKIPGGRAGRYASIGIDFNLYLAGDGRLMLFVENWSRRPGGRNCCMIETFDSLAEMKGESIRENSREIELPEKLLRIAGKSLLEKAAADNPGNIFCRYYL